jgi:ABC-type multidrug transport system permease subunit
VIPGVVACGLLWVASIVNMLQIPHPLWFMICGVLLYPLGASIGVRLVSPSRQAVES